MRKYFVAPKGIRNDLRVKRCLDGEAEGFDYKYDVELHDGYVFASGRMEGCQSARFHTVRDFQQVEILSIEEHKAKRGRYDR